MRGNARGHSGRGVPAKEGAAKHQAMDTHQTGSQHLTGMTRMEMRDSFHAETTRGARLDNNTFLLARGRGADGGAEDESGLKNDGLPIWPNGRRQSDVTQQHARHV